MAGGAAADCPDAVCTPFCPQFCGASLFFPPPASSLSLPSSSPFSLSLSPLLLALVAVLAAAAIFAAFRLAAARLRRNRPNRVDFSPQPPTTMTVLTGFRRDAAPVVTAGAGGGLDDGAVRRIPVCRYKKDDGLVMAEECPVCLAEFKDGESLRLLPDCLHAFHLDCIDPWLKTNTTCPICRATIDISSMPPPRPQLPPRPLPTVTVPVSRDPRPPPLERKGPGTSGTHSVVSVV